MDEIQFLEYLVAEKHLDPLKLEIWKTDFYQKYPKAKNEATNETFSQRYKVLKVLGEGGMGEVQKVKDRWLGREVALKKIRNARKKGASKILKKLIWRLSSEAMILSELEHPNIIPLYDMQQKEGGEVSFTMRKIEGGTLQEILIKKREFPTSYEETKLLSIFLKVCDAVSYAHSKGVIHRDLKPANIMVGQFGEVYVMDWGIAKDLRARSQEKSLVQSLGEIDRFDRFQTMAGLGTLGYMAPEQEIDASAATSQSDIYALGKVLKECFTLLSPTEEFREKLKHFKKKYKLEGKESVEIVLPEDIQAIVVKATANELKDRYETVQELAEDLERYQKNLRVLARKFTIKDVLLKWFKRNWKGFLVVGIMLLLLTGTFFFFQRKKQKEEAMKFSNALKEARLLSKEAFKKADNLELNELFQALNKVDFALSLKPNHPNGEKLKLQLVSSLIQVACQTKEFQLAKYLVHEIQWLKVLSESQKREIGFQVDEAKNKTLNQHLKRLAFWIDRLKSEEQGASWKQDALFEISKMSEREIFDYLIQFLNEGSQYFLVNNTSTKIQAEFYFTLVEALGRLERSEAGIPLMKVLEQMTEKVKGITPAKRPKGTIKFMVSLTNALAHSKAFGESSSLNRIRFQMGQESLYWNQTKLALKQLVSINLQKNKKSFAQENEFSFLYQGLVKQQQQDFLGALSEYNKVLKLNPENDVAYANRGEAHFYLRSNEKALHDLNQAIKLNPQNCFALARRGKIKLEQEKYQAALSDLNQAIQLSSQNPGAYQDRGTVKANLGQIDSAIKDFNEAIRFYSEMLQQDPYQLEIYLKRAEAKTALPQGEFGALEDYQNLLAKMSSTAERKISIENNLAATAYLNRANLKYENSDVTGAMDDYSEAIRLAPFDEKAYLKRGDLKFDLRDYKGALLDYKKALELNPFLLKKLKRVIADSYFKRGTILFRKNLKEKARVDFQYYLEWSQDETHHYHLDNRKQILALFPELQNSKATSKKE